MLEIRGLKKAYGKHCALAGIDVKVENGAIYGLVGADGAGKTTFLKILSSLLKADAGEIFLEGEDILADARRLKSLTGYVPARFGSYRNLTVLEYMEFFAACCGMDGLAARKRCMVLLEQVGLEDRFDFLSDALPVHLKQKLSLARAMIHDPALLLLDEPFSNLDPRAGLEFKELLRELGGANKTIVLTSRALSQLSGFCTQVGVIDRGKMVFTGSIREILSRVNTANPLGISVCSGLSEAMEILKTHPDVKSLSLKGQDISVRFNGDAIEEALLLKRLIEAGVAICSFSREKGSIETIFMQLMDPREEKVVTAYDAQSDL